MKGEDPVFDVVVCYSVEEGNIQELQHRLELLSLGAADAGLSTYIHVRDTQAWDLTNADYGAALAIVFRHIRRARVILIDTTREVGACLSGVNIEAGYAKALGKPIVALWHTPDRPDKTMALADFEASYRDIDDLRPLSHNLLMQTL
jgi:hypothetical protein